MDFDSPEAAKEFPGLYLAESGKVDDSLEYVDEGDKKKSKKEKKKDKDKGYSALAGESSHDEDDPLDSKSPGKGKKIKAFSKLSGKKKDKDKKGDKSDKEQKKAEKEAKEKRKSEEKERKSLEKELTTSSTSGSSSVAPRPQISFSGAHLMKANSLNHSAVLSPQASIDRGTPIKKNLVTPSIGEVGSKDNVPTTKPPKEKSAAFNVFLNAPAPLLSKLKDKDKDKDGSKEKHGKSKEHKDKKHKEKDKEKSEGKSKKEHKEHKEKDKDKKDHASGMAKVKLKLMRSKNSLEDPNDPPHITSHQFPEDPEALAKEIKKYEGLLEQMHLNLKSTKKISKKQEEQLWELQRTLTQLKRKLRSINALSSASAYHVHPQPAAAPPPNRVEHSVSPPRPIFKKCDSIDGRAKVTSVTSAIVSTISPPPAALDQQKIEVAPTAGATIITVPIDRTPVNAKLKAAEPAISAPVSIPPQEIPKIPLPPSKNSYKADSITVATSPPKMISPPPLASQTPIIASVNNETEQKTASTVEVTKSCRNSIVLSSPPPANAVVGTATTTIVTVESNGKICSPRPSIDTIAQVHSLSVSDDKSDEEQVQDEPQQVDEDDEEYLNRRSISNMSMESSQVDSKENIEAVLDDANKMIGSMHEELMFEGAIELVNGNDRLARLSGDHLNDSTSRMLGQQEDSDVELFTNDLELELPNEEPCPDPFSMPVFDTTEYISIENEALSMFNEQLTEDLKKEENDLDELLQKLPLKPPQNDADSSGNSQTESEYNDLIKVWTTLKSENEVLWDNVYRLRQAVASCKVDEFRLQTRLKYIETKSSALSPVTTTTPLQTEA